MYCPVCGEEIIIVSDFDIKIEDNIDVAALAKTSEIPDVGEAIDKRTKKKNRIKKRQYRQMTRSGSSHLP